MKKLLVLFMSLMMVCSLAACGGDEADTTGTSDVQNEENVSTGDDTAVDTQVVETETIEDVYFLSVGDFKTLPLLDMADLSGTTWMWVGATIDGTELDQESFLSSLEAYSGKNDIVFANDGTSVDLVQGAGTANGYCEYLEGGQSVGLAFDFNGTELRYVATLSEVEGVSVLVVMPDEANALYYILR